LPIFLRRRPPFSPLFPYTTLFRSLYFTLACNTPFWRALLASRGSEGGALAYLLALGVALTALNFLLFAPLLGRWMTKPLLGALIDRKSTRLNSSHVKISYAVFCLR